MRSPFFSSGSGVRRRPALSLRELLQLVFDADVRDHFATDLAEAREAVGDGEESVFFEARRRRWCTNRREELRPFLPAAEISLHHIWPLTSSMPECRRNGAPVSRSTIRR